jgi:aspartate aminotransferase
MPRTSEKGRRMPASPIRKLVPFADAAKARGTHVYALNIGQPDLPTPPEFWEALQALDIKTLAYSHSQGNESYQKQWAAYYQRFGANIDPQDVLITTGASEALSMAVMGCLNPGDEIIIPEPLYANYIGFATAADVVIKPIATRIDNGFALPPLEAFEQAIGPKTKAILICNPNNPTGYLYTEEELDTLRSIVLQHDLFLMVDEVYREFVYDDRKHRSIMTLPDLEQHVVVFDSISKRFSACGARIGALITRNNAVRDVCLKFAQMRLSPPTLGQLAAESLFDLPTSYYEGILEEYDKRRRYLVDRLKAMPGVRCPMPGGAFYAVVSLPVDDTDNFCQWLLESFEHNGATVMIAPAQGFYATPGAGRNQARVAYVLQQEDLAAAMDCLEAGLKQYPGRMI